MIIPSFERASEIPLLTDDLVLDRVCALLDHGALRRQLWLMFLDEDERQLPILMPIDVEPRPRRDDAPHFAAALGQIFHVSRAASMIVVYERCGSDTLSTGDVEWLRFARDACVDEGIPLRGPVLCHDDGVRWIAADDLLGRPARAT